MRQKTKRAKNNGKASFNVVPRAYGILQQGMIVSQIVAGTVFFKIKIAFLVIQMFTQTIFRVTLLFLHKHGNDIDNAY